MASLTAPRNGIPIGTAIINGVQVQVEVHPEYLRWFESLTGRVGGVSGASTNDLTVSQFEDAGIEETKHGLMRQGDDLWQIPPVVQLGPVDSEAPGLEELRGQIAELTKAVEALQQGLTA